MRELTMHEGIVYYMPGIHRFAQIREVLDGGLIIACSKWYDDVKTALDTIPVSFAYMGGAIEAKNLDELPEAEYCPDSGAWRVKRVKKVNEEAPPDAKDN